MIYAVSQISKVSGLKDHYKIFITRQEPEVNNNKVYRQEVSGSYESVKWYRKAILAKVKQQREIGS